jgi:hypothetical protein
MWLPLFALAGVGLMAMPRRVATLLVAAVAIASLALSVATTHRETSTLIPQLNAEIGPHDVAIAGWDQYLVLVDEAGPGVQARLHVVSNGNPPWWVGTAAYPAGAVIPGVPADVVAAGGRVFWIGDPGVATPPMPPGYRPQELSCAIEACLTIYVPAGG